MSMGKSPIGTKQDICTGCPEETGLSSKINGVILGGTDRNRICIVIISKRVKGKISSFVDKSVLVLPVCKEFFNRYFENKDDVRNNVPQ